MAVDNLLLAKPAGILVDVELLSDGLLLGDTWMLVKGWLLANALTSVEVFALDELDVDGARFGVAFASDFSSVEAVRIKGQK